MRNKILTQTEDLDRYIARIEKVFSINDLINAQCNKDKIASYYTNSSSGYKYLHSKDGAVHLAINYDGVFNEDGYLTQVKEIAQVIEDCNYTSILELGCGKGFNSIHLAKRFKNVKFNGVDITHKHLHIAKENSKSLDNLIFSYGDFHKLEYKSNTFDLIFEIESVCHALNPEEVLKSVYNALQPHGRFILYEGFRRDHFNTLPINLQKAAILTEKSMAVNGFIEISQWLKLAEEIGFKIRLSEDISRAIIPNLGRFQRMARAYFKYPLLAKMFLFFLPKEMLINSIAGLLLPFTVMNKAQGYYKIIMEK